MTTVTGEAALLLDVLGHRKGDRRILDAIALLGPQTEREDFDFDGEKSTYLIFKPAGTDLLFENDVLVSITVRTHHDDHDPDYAPYPRPKALIDGLPPTATRAETAALLGPPERTGPNFDRYEANKRYLHFEFEPNGRISKLSALLEPI
ncbi:hypothetical protein [Nocardiopsis suaedae]|uniref:Uncharacterized protein n=1 Tax=Nocardiopsis suaedae TaxID=3018444 RepID=A0ABT4TW03_9ACTN|nr:hypothetical protein [Nocardiopsis suaedae]MDA2808400.1 hypothetical protein [Nocardiopsis suaedae]